MNSMIESGVSIKMAMNKMTSDEIEQMVKSKGRVYAREIWNAAIEKAIQVVPSEYEKSMLRQLKINGNDVDKGK